MALSSSGSSRVSARTRWSQGALVLLLALACAALAILANVLAWRPGARVQLDLTATGELRVHPATRETLLALEAPVEVTALFSRQPTRRQHVFDRLCFGRGARELFARMEHEVRLRAIERVRAWLERLEVLSQGRLLVRWLDREQDFLEYEDAIEKLDLLADGRLRRYLGGIEGVETGAAQRRIGRSALHFQGLRELARHELPEGLSVLDEVEVVDLVVVEQGGRRELLFLEPDLAGIDHCHLWGTGPERAPSLVEMRVESALLAAAERVLPRGALRVAWIAGQGLGPREMPAFVAELDRTGALVRARPVNLRDEGPPADIDLLLGFAPQRAFEPAEREALERYLRGGGALLAAEKAREDLRPSPWNEALAPFGIAFGTGRVCQAREAGELGSERCSWLRVEAFNPKSEITHAYAANGWSLELRDAREVELSSAREAGSLVYELMWLRAPGTGGLVLDPAADVRIGWIDAPPFDLRPAADSSEKRAIFPLAHALELPAGGRIVASGSTWPFEDSGIRSDARFAAHVVRWLGDRGIAPSGAAQRIGHERFEVKGPLGPTYPDALQSLSREEVLSIFLRYALPTSALVLGLGFWWWRRRA